MSFKYDFNQLKQAILFNVSEVLPNDPQQLDQEIQVLVDQANESGQKIRHYIGFEISGQVHIGSGIASALKIQKLTEAGVECHIWLADFHTWINNKLDGKIETARRVAKEYFAPVMLECMEVCGCDMSLIKILYANEEYENKKNGQQFFAFDLMIAKSLTLARVLKSISITGKKEGEGVEFATLRYPPMQVADAFFLGTHLVHAGMDQRKAHVLMREAAFKLDDDFSLKIGQNKIAPIAIHHSLLLSLSKPNSDGLSKMKDEIFEDNKMSKSKPDSAMFVHDSATEIRRKIKNAYCPMIDKNLSEIENQQIQNLNPLWDWCQKMIFPANKILEVIRPEKFGGNKNYTTLEELKLDYFAGNLHPMDLKNAVAEVLIKWFLPICEYVQKNPAGLELVKEVRK